MTIAARAAYHMTDYYEFGIKVLWSDVSPAKEWYIHFFGEKNTIWNISKYLEAL